MVPSKHRNRFITINAPSQGESGWGQTRTWAKYVDAWVSITPNRGQERFDQDSRENTVSHTIRGEWMDLKDVKPEMQVVLTESGTTRYFDIKAVMNDEDHHRDTMLKVEEKANADAT